jgi:hypothetical protein
MSTGLVTSSATGLGAVANTVTRALRDPCVPVEPLEPGDPTGVEESVAADASADALLLDDTLPVEPPPVEPPPGEAAPDVPPFDDPVEPGAGPGAVTELDNPDGPLVPIEFVAVTVNV